MEQIESERDQHKDRCTQLENQLEISQKIVDTQQLSLDAKEVGLLDLLTTFIWSWPAYKILLELF